MKVQAGHQFSPHKPRRREKHKDRCPKDERQQQFTDKSQPEEILRENEAITYPFIPSDAPTKRSDNLRKKTDGANP